MLFNFHSLFNFHIDSSTFKLSRQNQYVNFNIIKTFYLYKMENEILESINYIKNISNKRETIEKIFTNIKKRNLTITYEDLQHILEKSSYWQYIAWKREWSISSNNNLLTGNIILEETNLEQSIQEDTNVNHDNILNEIRSFKKISGGSRE